MADGSAKLEFENRGASIKPERTASTAVQWPRDLLTVVLLFAAVTYTTLLVSTALNRIFYPFELEWIEGATVEHVIRVLHGDPLFRRPSVDFIPNIYPAVYYYASALMSQITGPGFTALRLVSFLSALGTMALVFRFVLRESRSRLGGIIGAGAFAAFYEFTGAWYDVAAVDGLFLLLSMACIFTIRFHPTVTGYILAGTLFVLAGMTKQMAVTLLVPLLPYVFSRGIRPAMAFCATSSIGLALFLLANFVSDGWFYYYTVQLPSEHPWEKHLYLGFWLKDLPPMLPAYVAGWYAILWASPARSRSDIMFFLVLTLSAVLTCWYSRLHSGGYVNTLLPAVLVCSILAGIGSSYLQFASSGKLGIARTVVGLILVLQFILLIYNPTKLIPTAADKAAGHQLMKKAAQFKGEVCFLYHAYLPRMIGKPPFTHVMSYEAIRWGRRGPVWDEIEKEMHEVFRSQRFDAVILDNGDWPPETRALVKQYYKPLEKVFSRPDVFWPIAGFQVRPDEIYVPRLQIRKNAERSAPQQ